MKQLLFGLRLQRVLPVIIVAASCLIVGILGATSTAAFTDPTDSHSNSIVTDTLDPPTGLTVAEAPLHGNELNWTASADTYTTGYEVYRSTTSGSGHTSVGTVTAPATSFTDTTHCTNATGPTYVAKATTRFDSVTSFTLDKPDGTIENDFLFLEATIDNLNTRFITPPAGWTTLASTSSSSQVATIVLYAIAGASEPASYDFTISGASTGHAVLYAYRGVDTAPPIDAWATNTGTGWNATAPSITTTVDNTLVLRLFSNDDPAVDPHQFHTERGETARHAVDSTWNSSWMSEEPQATAGATGTMDTQSYWAEDWVAYTIALRPANYLDCPAVTWTTTEVRGNRENVPFYTTIVPDNTAIGDYLLTFITLDGPDPAIVAPAGWTLLASGNLTATVDSFALYGRVADATDATGSGDPGDVTFWSDINYAGTSWSVGTRFGNQDNISPIGNDTISSIQVPAGRMVQACADDSLRGVCYTFTTDTPTMPSGFDDAISSILVSESPAYTWTWTGNRQVTATMLRLTGVDTTTPIDAIATTTGDTSSNFTAPSVTTTVDNTLILRFIAADANGAGLLTTLPGLDPRHNQRAIETTSLIAANHQRDPGPTGAAAFPADESEQFAAITVAIRPDTSVVPTYHYVVRSQFNNWESASSNEDS